MPDQLPNQLRILLLGCGDLASRLALLRAGEWHFTGVRRTVGDVPGVDVVQADARDSVGLRHLLAQGVDVVVATLTPASFSDEGYTAGYVAPAEALREACEVLPPNQRPRRILWVSSTRVYGAGDGGWVDEATPPQPERFAGHRLLEAESVLQSGAVPVTVVRFSGIYGPGRDRMIRKVRDGRIASAEPLQWTNRIHSDDCAGVLAHLIDREISAEPLAGCYIGSDCEPAPAHQVQRWLAEQLGVVPEEEPVAGKASAGRRCSNRLLLESGYRFRYPDWREGYAALLGASDVDVCPSSRYDQPG